MKPEYLMLAQTYKNHAVDGWYVSEKLDGSRAFWDGGISRHCPAADVPWANSYKDSRLQEPPVSTGLWSRTGKVVHAPDWFIDGLPKGLLLDGELSMGRGTFQTTRTVVAPKTPGEGWKYVRYAVFDSPPKDTFFRARDIKVRNDYSFSVSQGRFSLNDVTVLSPTVPFSAVYRYLQGKLHGNPVAQVIEQLPVSTADLQRTLDRLVADGAEGLVLRDPKSTWVAGRSWSLLKMKPTFTANGRVVGYRHGRGRFRGRMGALIVEVLDDEGFGTGTQLKLSGFTDEQRWYGGYFPVALAYTPEGAIAADDVVHTTYPRGTIVEFKYRELSDDNVPKDARFFRKI